MYHPAYDIAEGLSKVWGKVITVTRLGSDTGRWSIAL